jgi:outer membrane lipoprotein
MIPGIPIPGIITAIARSAAWVLAVAALAGCAAGPRFDTAGVETALTPDQVSVDIDRWRGSGILWGGVVVASRNLAHTSEIEVLAYPLDANQRPKSRSKALGRFVAVVPGYLETMDYGAGRALTVRGTVAAVERRYVGEVGYDYPVVNAEQLYLWPSSAQQEWSPQFHIGIGVGL